MAEEAVKDVHGADSVPEEPMVEEQVAQEEVPQGDFSQETQPTQAEVDDWRMKAIQDPRVRERFDQALFGQQEQAAPPAPDPVEQARAQLQEIEQNMPQLDERNMTADQVTAFMQWQENRNSARQAVYDAELQQTRAELEAQKARNTLDEYVESTRSQDPAFKEYENEFRKYVQQNNIDPKLLQNRTVVEMIRKAIGYDHLSTRRKAQAPGAPAVDESYNAQGRAARQRQAEQEQSTREPTELDLQLSAFYGIPVEQLLENEQSMAPDSERWEMKGSVQWSDQQKLKRAGIRR